MDSTVRAGKAGVASRRARFLRVLERLSALPPASTGLQAYAELSVTLNELEDAVWGRAHWAPPRSFLDGRRTARLYPIMPESFHPVTGYAGVVLLLAKRELVFISRLGAMEVQDKDPADPRGRRRPFGERPERVVFRREDAAGDGVWHAKNAR